MASAMACPACSESSSNRSCARCRRREIVHAQAETNREISRHDEEIAALEAKIDSLKAQLAAQDAVSQRSVTQSVLKVLEHQSGLVLTRLRARFLAAARSASLIDHSDRLASLRLGELMRTLAAVRAQNQGLEPPAWPRDPSAMDALIDPARASTRIWPSASKGLLTTLEGLNAGRRALAQDNQELMEKRGGLLRDAADAVRILGGGHELVGSRECLRRR